MSDELDRLAEMFALQEQLQVEAYSNGLSPRHFSDEGRIEFIKTNVLAATDELHEALGEVGWKPWATSRHINTDALRAELVDTWHFFMNLCIVAGMTPEDLYEGYLKKRKKNIQRQEEGYDGVTLKCPGCKRALDDDAVTCCVDTVGVGWMNIYCFVKNKTFRVDRQTSDPSAPNYYVLEG